MKRVLIIEDEKPASKRLQRLLADLNPEIEIIDIIDSVEDAVNWFNNFPQPDLAFFDIQLADGLSFNIFKKTQVECPVIFTTAYDQYAIKAFKVNSIDYLLKPIDPKELNQAWEKFLNLASNQKGDPDFSQLLAQLQSKKKFKERFLIKKGDGYQYIHIGQVAYFYSDGGLTFLMDLDNKKHIIDDKMDGLETDLDPDAFLRISRKFIVGEKSVQKISKYFNSRLLLELHPAYSEQVIVARERVQNFKAWLNQ